MYCPNCGNIIEDNMNFCISCGAKVNETVQPEVVQQPMMAPIYQQPVNTFSTGGFASNKKIASITAILLSVITVIAIIVALKPLFYYTQSYVGGAYSSNATLMSYIRWEDPDGELDSILKILCFAVAAVYFVSMLLSISVAKKAKNITTKPATVKSFFVMVFTGVASGALLFFDTFTREEIGNTYDDVSKFNIYNIFIIIAVVVVVMVVVNFFVTLSAKSKWKKNGYRR